MSPTQIAELRDELQTAARDYARLADSCRHKATYDLACYAGNHLDNASVAERHAGRYRRAAEAISALTAPRDARVSFAELGARVLSRAARVDDALSAIERLREALTRISLGTDAPDADVSGDRQHGLHCGVEDVNCRDRYEGADYGYASGVDRALEWARNEADSALEAPSPSMPVIEVGDVIEFAHGNDAPMSQRLSHPAAVEDWNGKLGARVLAVYREIWRREASRG